VLNRKEFGHWEADLVKDKKTKNQPAIITLVERQTRFAFTMKINNFKSDAVLMAFQNMLHKKEQLFKSITFDNGSEFSKVHKLETKQLQIYFAHAYSSWERGTNKNFNQMLREHIPKGISLHQYSKDYLETVTYFINRMYRACLDGLSAEECFLLAHQPD